MIAGKYIVDPRYKDYFFAIISWSRRVHPIKAGEYYRSPIPQQECNMKAKG